MSQRLLVLDDDAELRNLLQGYLGEQGFDVAAVEDGAAMREALGAGDFDLVILDLMLPGEDGLALCRELRARSRIPAVIDGEPMLLRHEAKVRFIRRAFQALAPIPAAAEDSV